MASALAAAVEGRSTAHDANTLLASAPPDDPSVAPRAASAAGSDISPLRLALLGMGAVVLLGAIAYVVTLGPWSRSSDDASDDALAQLSAAPDEELAPAPAKPVAPVASRAVAEPAPPTAPEAAPAPQAQPVAVEAPLTPAPTEPAAPPQAAPAAQPAAQGLPQAALSLVLATAQTELQRCYEHAMVAALTDGQEALPALAFEVSFGITKEGRVERTQLNSTQGRAPSELRACLQGAIEGLRFPASGAPSELRFPLVFQPSVVGP